jgi:hypothetical protein
MKNILLTIAAMMLSNLAVSQSTTTYVDKHGQRTEISVACDHNGDNCKVWDSTNDPHLTMSEIHKDSVAREKFCKSQSIPTSRWSLKKNAACQEAWDNYKADLLLKSETH